jgi:hypothetical protein
MEENYVLASRQDMTEESISPKTREAVSLRLLGHNDNSHRVFVGGVDMCYVNPQMMEIQSCMAARYDAGIIKHQREHTGVIEVWKLK